jgi:hypothetical protein
LAGQFVLLLLYQFSALAEQQLAYTLCTSKLAEVLEKVLKAELLRLGWFLVKTHDLQELASELQARHSDLLLQLRPLCAATGLRVAIGQTRAGRYLRVIYVPDPDQHEVFVITAYDLCGKPRLAYRSRRRQRQIP